MKLKIGFLIITMVISFMSWTGVVFADNSTVQIGEEYDITVTGKDISIKITPGGSNVLSGAAASCSDAAGPSEDAFKLTDGNYATKWHDTENGPKWWQGDMGVTNRISTFVLYNTGTKETNSNTGAFTIKVSSNGTDWSGVWVSTKSPSQAADIMVYKLNTPVSARYIRMEINDDSAAAASLYEFEAWGEANTVDRIDPVNITTAAGYAPVLPPRVSIFWKDGSTGEAAVTWDSVDPASYAQAGTFTVRGSVEGTSVAALAYVTVTNSQTATLTGPNQATEGIPFVLTCGLAGVRDISAQDITISYDSGIFEFVSAEPVREGTVLQGVTDKPDEGKVKLILANLGQENAINGNADLFDITFKPKVPGTGTIAVTNASLSNSQGGVSEAAGMSKAVDVEADKSQLISAISAAQAKYDSAEAGSEPGQYPQAAKEALFSEISAANTILADKDVTNLQVAQAVTDLNAAVALFDAAMIRDVDKTALASAITNALTIYNQAEEGVSIGDYPAGTKGRLNEAISKAIITRDSPATASQVEAAIAELNTAVARFRSLVITSGTGDINRIAGVDIGDLGMIAMNYGLKAGDPGWDMIKQADINGDGEIGLYELAFVAGKLVNG